MKQFNNLREEALLEKLKASDPTGKWISDFVHSDNPKFAGKSKKERIRMALGASYGAKRNEEVEQVDEISSGLATSYLNKRTAQHKPNLNSPETSNRDAKVAKGISSASRREHGFGPDKSAANKVTSRFDYRKKVGATHTFNNEEVEAAELDEMDKSVENPGGKEYQAKPVKAKEFIKTVGKRLHKALTGGSDKDQLDRLRKNMYGESADICPVCETDPCVCETGQHIEEQSLDEAKPGLYANIHAKRKRIAAGSGERMRKPGSKGAPTAQSFRDAAKTAK